MKEYLYDVFLSFTGADRELKDALRVCLEASGMRCYDSDLYCKGQFRADFCEALDRSRVYLMILSDNLRNDPTVTGHGTFTEVRREGGLACQLEAAGELNIVILCMSEFFRFAETFHDYRDTVGWHFYSLTRGFSEIFGQVEADGSLSRATLDSVCERCRDFVERRRAGSPIPSEAPRLEIAEERLPERESFCGREGEIEAVLSAFRDGKRAVVLSGLGGIGKTTLATEIARRASAEGYLRCPQIVHIREMADGGGGLATLLGSVSYARQVYDSMATLCERDRYERKLRALSSLPENVLLVVDNYNDLREDTLSEMLSRLSCRLLLTTRARLLPREGVAILPIEPLPGDEAYRMFCEAAGGEVARGDFDTLYRFTGGHTITLCIMARIMAAHGMTAATLLSHLDGLDSFDARVDFRHNEHGDSDTVLGHLRKLFDLSGLDGECCRILRSLSILGDGRILLSDLERVLSLSSRNAVLELSKNGWITLLRHGEEGETVYLHPILSRLSAELLTPREDTVSEMIAYLADTVRAARTSMTYTDAARLADSLYYACYVLAGNSHTLPRELFVLFGDVNHLLGDAEETVGRMRLLSGRLSDRREAAEVVAYGDMLLLEQHPMHLEIIESYMRALEENAENYKWLLRALSVTLSHIVGVPHLRPFYLGALRVALRAAMERQDDLAVTDLAKYALATGEDSVPFAAMLRRYLRRRGRDVKKSPLLITLSIQLTSRRMYGYRGDEGEKARETIVGIADGNYKKVVRRIALHPVAALSGGIAYHRIRRLSDGSATTRVLKATYAIAEELLAEGRADPLPLIEAMVELHGERLAHHLTLASAAEEVRGAVSFFQSLPSALVKQEVTRLAAGVDEENVSVASVSSLQVAALLNEAIGDREALTQSRKLLSVVRRLRPDGHNDVNDALLGHAALCDGFGEYEEAYTCRMEVYRRLSEDAPGSQRQTEVASRLLHYPALSREPSELIFEVRDTALAGAEVDSASYYEALCSYFRRLSERYQREPSKENEALLDAAEASLSDAGGKVRTIGMLAQQTVLYALQDAAYRVRYEARAERLLGMIEPYKKSKHARIRAIAALLAADVERMLAYERCLPCDALRAAADRVIDTALKKKLGWASADAAAQSFFLRFLREGNLLLYEALSEPGARIRAMAAYDCFVTRFLERVRQAGGELTDEELGTRQRAELLRTLTSYTRSTPAPQGRCLRSLKTAESYYAYFLSCALTATEDAVKESTV